MNLAAAVAQALAAFLAAFNELDHERLCTLLADGVTLFPPGAGPRVEGKVAVAAHFAGVFAAEAPDGPGIRPIDLQIQAPSDEGLAVASFRFDRREGGSGRRTLVFVLEAGAWKVLHLHASNTA